MNKLPGYRDMWSIGTAAEVRRLTREKKITRKRAWRMVRDQRRRETQRDPR